MSQVDSLMNEMNSRRHTDDKQYMHSYLDNKYKCTLTRILNQFLNKITIHLA